MTPEKTIKIKKIGNFLEIDGEWYFPKQHSRLDSGKSIIFKKVNRTEITQNITFLTKILKRYVDKGMILEDALSEMKSRELEKIIESMRLGKKAKVKNRYGCVELDVNGVSIPIR